MYSILIKTTLTSDTYKYYYNANGEIYIANTIEELENKINTLAKTYPINQIVAVKNCIISGGLQVQEMTA